MASPSAASARQLGRVLSSIATSFPITVMAITRDRCGERAEPLERRDTAQGPTPEGVVVIGQAVALPSAMQCGQRRSALSTTAANR